uniref:Uncharacterized protein n=1 Tax=Romanomermis culicivorax TaxID=13658 RepID=A0A915K297_ROMCU
MNTSSSAQDNGAYFGQSTVFDPKLYPDYYGSTVGQQPMPTVSAAPLYLPLTRSDHQTEAQWQAANAYAAAARQPGNFYPGQHFATTPVIDIYSANAYQNFGFAAAGSSTAYNGQDYGIGGGPFGAQYSSRLRSSNDNKHENHESSSSSSTLQSQNFLTSSSTAAADDVVGDFVKKLAKSEALTTAVGGGLYTGYPLAPVAVGSLVSSPSTSNEATENSRKSKKNLQQNSSCLAPINDSAPENNETESISDEDDDDDEDDEAVCGDDSRRNSRKNQRGSIRPSTASNNSGSGRVGRSSGAKTNSNNSNIDGDSSEMGAESNNDGTRPNGQVWYPWMNRVHSSSELVSNVPGK